MAEAQVFFWAPRGVPRPTHRPSSKRHISSTRRLVLLRPPGPEIRRHRSLLHRCAAECPPFAQLVLNKKCPSLFRGRACFETSLFRDEPVSRTSSGFDLSKTDRAFADAVAVCRGYGDEPSRIMETEAGRSGLSAVSWTSRAQVLLSPVQPERRRLTRPISWTVRDRMPRT
jgi:hypothetical protein